MISFYYERNSYIYEALQIRYRCFKESLESAGLYNWPSAAAYLTYT